MAVKVNPIVVVSCAALCIVLVVAGQAAAGDLVTENVWPGEAPGSEGLGDTEKVMNRRAQDDPRGPLLTVTDVTVPTLTYYPAPKDKATPTAIIVCPGGGYSSLPKLTADYSVAKWLNSKSGDV